MSKRRDQDFLSDIQEAIQRIAAAKNLSSRLRKRYSQIPWKDLAGVRDKMIHHYFGINYEIVWTIAREELPRFLQKIEDILTMEAE
ncbi:MAG: DUF86 domain-containing protein [Candidatus Tectomicrobia bacterium]|uniref:DUF86 domain-containing protein n=1 Tax=Tectimicrobiota bacterium TaxID=2528274 RepID=A0A932GRR0_UNCTE|nr:DUF86 domain-containing protein [Candidatus Tectomicrobia bacterium]